MEKLRSEVYLECGSTGLSKIDIFSHVKNEWVYSSAINSGDLLNLFDDLMIKPESTIIHLSNDHPAYISIKGKKFITHVFNGVSGKYKTLDDSVYQIEYKPAKSPKSSRVLIAKCIKSLTKEGNAFPIDQASVEKNLRHLTWTKIE